MTRARVVDAVFLAALSAYVVAGASLVPFHGDEATLLHMSRDYGYQFVEGDWQRVRFDEAWTHGDDQLLRLINGTVSKYAFGAAWHLAGYSLADVNAPWDWRTDWNTNVANGHMPPAGLLLSARLASCLMLAGAVAALFVLARRLGGRPVAYLACLYFALNPAVLLNGRRAMMESALLLSAVLVALAGLRYLARPGYGSAVLLGLASGLALSAKHTNLFVVGAVLGGCALYPIVDRRWRGDALVHTVVATLVGAALFLALNPAWWGRSPIALARAVLQERQELLQSFVSGYGGYPDASARAAGAFRETFIVEPQYFEVARYGPPVADQIRAYESSGLAGISIGGSVAGGWVVMGLVLLGAGLFLMGPLPLQERWLGGVWSVAGALPILLLTPLAWQRYYLPVFPVVALFGAIGCVGIAARGRSRAVRPPVLTSSAHMSTGAS